MLISPSAVKTTVDTCPCTQPAVTVSRPQTNRLSELDALRGIGAMTVALFHFQELWLWHSIAPSIRFGVLMPFHVFLVGHEAVLLFFILSGFVLAIPAVQSHPQSYPVFLVRRVFRIYLPYLVALALAACGAAFFHSPLPLSPWFAQSWSTPVDWLQVWQHVLFLGSYDTAQYNHVFWSLVIEMRVSLVFPILCALVLRMRPRTSNILAIACSLIAITLQYKFPSLLDAGKTIHYGAMFVIGINLARQQKQMSTFYHSLSRRKKIFGAIACALLYIYAKTLLREKYFYIADWLPVIGICGIITISLNSNHVRRILLSKPLQFLGDISYSVYLIHCTVLYVLIHLLYGHIPLIAIAPIYVLTFLPISVFLNRTIERPAMQAGRRISNLFNAKKLRTKSVVVESSELT